MRSPAIAWGPTDDTATAQILRPRVSTGASVVLCAINQLIESLRHSPTESSRSRSITTPTTAAPIPAIPAIPTARTAIPTPTISTHSHSHKRHTSQPATPTRIRPARAVTHIVLTRAPVSQRLVRSDLLLAAQVRPPGHEVMVVGALLEVVAVRLRTVDAAQLQ